jgi:hypothetical protein
MQFKFLVLLLFVFVANPHISLAANCTVSTLTPAINQAGWDKLFFGPTTNPLPKSCDSEASVHSNSCAKNFAWVQYTWIRAYMSMAATYGNTKYLDRAKTVIDFIFSRQSSAGGWGAPLDQPQYFLDSAMTTHGIAYFIYVVYSDPRFVKYRSIADQYLPKIEEVIHHFDSEWAETTGFPGIGFYLYASCGKNKRNLCGKSSLLMYNQGATMSKAQLLIDRIYRLKGKPSNPKYLHRASKSAEYFKRFAKNTGGSYQWNYGGARTDSDDKSEDIGHGHLDLSLITWAAKYGIGGLTNKDMQLLASTLRKNVLNGEAGPKDVSMHVNGSGQPANNADRAIIGYDWIELADYDAALFDKIITIFNDKMTKSVSGNPNAALGWAEVLRKKSCVDLINYYVPVVPLSTGILTNKIGKKIMSKPKQQQ